MRAGLWRTRARMARGKSAGLLILSVPILARDLFRARRRAGEGITIAKPAREIAVLAALRAERRKFRHARFAANRAGFGRCGAHSLNICALGASSARPGSVSIRTCLPVRRASSSIHSGLSLALRAG